MRREIISCDECGQEKKDDLWWSLLTAEKDNAYFVYSPEVPTNENIAFDWDEDSVERKDLCSEQCLSKAEFRVRNRIRERKINGKPKNSNH